LIQDLDSGTSPGMTENVTLELDFQGFWGFPGNKGSRNWTWKIVSTFGNFGFPGCS